MACLGDFGLSNRYRTWAIVLLAIVLAVLGAIVVVVGPIGGWIWDWPKKNREFDALFELQSTTGANLKASIVTLAPLLARLTGLLD